MNGRTRSQRLPRISVETLFAGLPAGVCYLDDQLRVLYFNAEYARYLERYADIAPARLLGTFWPKLLGLAEELTDRIWRAVELGQAVREPVIRLKNPHTHEESYWDVSITPTQEGAATHLLVLTVDITERVRAEQLAQDQRAQLEAILANIAEGMIVACGDGTVLRINETAAAILEVTPAEVLGARPSGAAGTFWSLDGQEIPWGHTPLARAVRGEAQRHVVLEYRPASGSPSRILNISATPILDARGRVRMAVAILQDISELKEVQRAYAELQRLDQHKAEFLNAVSHELRTPLTAIIGYAEFLDEGLAGALSDGQRDFVNQILNGTDRMQHLINDLLDFARMEAGAFKLEISTVEYRGLVERTVASLDMLARRKNLGLRVELDPEVQEVKADTERVAQILTNLLSNAVKFTPEGGWITVRACVCDGWVITEVIDTGIGIPSESIDRLFAKFYQVPGNTGSGPSTGLGLAITKGLVEAHGGTIEVESTLHRGTTFRFTLPTARDGG